MVSISLAVLGQGKIFKKAIWFSQLLLFAVGQLLESATFTRAFHRFMRLLRKINPINCSNLQHSQGLFTASCDYCGKLIRYIFRAGITVSMYSVSYWLKSIGQPLCTTKAWHFSKIYLYFSRLEQQISKNESYTSFKHETMHECVDSEPISFDSEEAYAEIHERSMMQWGFCCCITLFWSSSCTNTKYVT